MKKEKTKTIDFTTALIDGSIFIVDSVVYTSGDTVSYLFKSLLSIFNREKTDLEIIVVKKRTDKKPLELDLQSK